MQSNVGCDFAILGKRSILCITEIRPAEVDCAERSQKKMASAIGSKCYFIILNVLRIKEKPQIDKQLGDINSTSLLSLWVIGF